MLVLFRKRELWIWVGVELQTFRDWHLKKRQPKDLVFVLETERSLLLLDLREREGS